MGPLQTLGNYALILKKAVTNAVKDMNTNHSFAISAGLSYYFLLSLFPALIFAAAVLACLPIPHLFDGILNVMARVAPSDSMSLIRKVVASILSPKRRGLISFGVLGALWSASGGFSAIMEGLNVAYNVPENRPYWRTRLTALGLTFMIGVLVVVAFGLMIVGPRFGEWLAGHLNLTPVFAMVWPWIQWGVSLAFVILAVELLYYIAPNVKQQFKSTLLGAVLSVVVWMAASYILGIYFRHFANYNATYGSLGAVIALMLWFYVSGVALLFGAEINAEYRKACGQAPLEIRCGSRKLPMKEKQPRQQEKIAA